MDRYSMNFGKKERVLNYACQTYQLSRPNKVGAVMALIRDCQPSSFEEWQSWYFDNAHTESLALFLDFLFVLAQFDKISFFKFLPLIVLINEC